MIERRDLKLKKRFLAFIASVAFLTVLCYCFCSACYAEKKEHFTNTVICDKLNSTIINKVIIENHDYYYVIYSGYKAGGVSMMHSEACKCKNK